MVNINYIQEASESDVDTLTEAYSGQWEGLAGVDQHAAHGEVAGLAFFRGHGEDRDRTSMT